MTADQLPIWKAITGHVISIILVLGFFAIVLLALIGKFNLADPTTATFIGTVTGYAIGQLARPLAYYFAIPREILNPSESNGGNNHVRSI